jgi:hypothetical protein
MMLDRGQRTVIRIHGMGVSGKGGRQRCVRRGGEVTIYIQNSMSYCHKLLSPRTKVNVKLFMKGQP